MIIKIFAIILALSNALASDGKSMGPAIGSNTDVHEVGFKMYFQDPSMVELFNIDSLAYADFGDHGVISQSFIENTLYVDSKEPGAYFIKADLKAGNLSQSLLNGRSFFHVNESIVVGDNKVRFWASKPLTLDIQHMMDIRTVYAYDLVFDNPQRVGQGGGYFAVRLYLRVRGCEFRFALMMYSYTDTLIPDTPKQSNRWILSPIQGFGAFKKISAKSPAQGDALRYNCNYQNFDIMWLESSNFKVTWESDH